MATTSKSKTAPAAEVTKLYKSLFDYALDANRAVVSGMERSWQEQVEAFEGAVQSIKPLAEVKKPEELLKAQMALATDLNKQAVATANTLMQIQRETGAELRDIASESYQAVSAAMPKAA